MAERTGDSQRQLLQALDEDTNDIHLLPLPPFSSSSSTTVQGDYHSSTAHSVKIQKVSKGTRVQKYRQWWLELVGVLASLALLVATIAFLAKLDGSRLDHWHLTSKLSPATIVSILVTACRIALAFTLAEALGQLKWVFFQQGAQTLSDFQEFDEATRGPWGALCFLYRMRGRAIAASLGATLLILVLAMEPFSQQVIFYRTRDIAMPGTLATIGAAQFYDSGAVIASIPVPASKRAVEPDKSSSDRRDIEHSDCADTLMTRAAYGGLFNADTATRFSCISGNCTWPSFTTLSICGECTDVTASVQTDCKGVVPEGHICQLSVPGQGPVVSQGPKDPQGLGPVAGTFKSVCEVDEYHTLLNGALWRSELTNETSKSRSYGILTFNTYKFPRDYVKPQDCALPTPLVRNCSLSWCARTFHSVVVTNNALVKAESSITDLAKFNTSDPECPGLAKLTPPQSEHNITWQGLINTNNRCPQKAVDVKPNDAFWINTNDHAMTVRLLEDMVTLNEITTNGGTGLYGTTPSDSGNVAVLSAIMDSNGGDLSKTISNIATSMTNRIREAPNAHTVEGTNTITVTVIKVNWYWLIYLGAMVGLGSIFFVTAMVFSAEKSQVVWKSSSLAVLFHGLDGFRHTDLSTQSIRSMSERAKHLEATLEHDQDGELKLVRQ